MSLPTTQSQNLAEGLVAEQARCRELLELYKALGAPGAFGAAMIEASLHQADQAVASGDVIAMLRAYQTLKDHE